MRLFRRLYDQRSAESLAANALKRRAIRERLKEKNRCVNDNPDALKHGVAVTGGRCASCWEKKSSSEGARI